MAANDQKPIGSGFGYRSTAREVIGGRSLKGKNAIVTGGYSGIGIEAVKALVEAGASVTVPARRPEVARKELEGVASVEVAELDLADLGSVKRFADAYVKSGRPLHILINNAAIMASPEARVGPGWEAQFATNHLGHFALVAGLESALKAAKDARVISVASIGHRRSPIVFDDIHFTKRPYQKWEAYGQAKTANALFAVELDRRGQAHGVRAFSLHPGGIMTPLQRHMSAEEIAAMGWVDKDGKPLDLFKTTEQGASTTVWAATSPQLDGKGGLYCEDCEVAALNTEQPGPMSGVRPYAVDPEEAKKLWAASVEMTGVDAFA